MRVIQIEAEMGFSVTKWASVSLQFLPLSSEQSDYKRCKDLPDLSLRGRNAEQKRKGAGGASVPPVQRLSLLLTGTAAQAMPVLTMIPSRHPAIHHPH